MGHWTGRHPDRVVMLSYYNVDPKCAEREKTKRHSRSKSPKNGTVLLPRSTKRIRIPINNQPHEPNPAHQVDLMKKLRIVHDGVLCRNPFPSHRASCAFQPNIVALSDDEMICLDREGSAFYSHDGRLCCVPSTEVRPGTKKVWHVTRSTSLHVYCTARQSATGWYLARRRPS